MRVVGWLPLLLAAAPCAWANTATKKCGDAECEQPLFTAVAKRDIAQSHEDFLAFKEGQIIRVFAVDFSDRPDLWEGQAESGQRGFFYRSHVRQNNYLGYLRKAVKDDADMHTLLRERKPPAHVKKYQGPVKVRSVLGKALEVEEHRAQTDGFPDGQPDPISNLPTPASPVEAQTQATAQATTLPPAEPPKLAAEEAMEGEDSEEALAEDSAAEVFEEEEEPTTTPDPDDSSTEEIEEEEEAPTTTAAPEEGTPSVDGEAAEEAAKAAAEAARVKREAEELAQRELAAAKVKAEAAAKAEAARLEEEARIKAETAAAEEARAKAAALKAQAEAARIKAQEEAARLAAAEAEEAKRKAALAAAQAQAEAEAKAKADAEAKLRAEAEAKAKAEAALSASDAVGDALLKEIEAGGGSEEDLEKYIQQKEAEMVAQTPPPPPSATPTPLPAQQPPVPTTPTPPVAEQIPPVPSTTALPPVPPKRKITLGSALNHGHSHGGHGHAHGDHSHGHSHEATPSPAPAQATATPAPTPPNIHVPVTQPTPIQTAVTEAMPADAFAADSVVVESETESIPVLTEASPPEAETHDTPATPESVPEHVEEETLLATEVPMEAVEANTLSPNSQLPESELPPPPEIHSEIKDGLGDSYCIKGDCDQTQTLDESSPSPPLDPSNQPPPDSAQTEHELPPHLRDIPKHLMKDAGLLPPEETGPSWADRLRPLISGLRSVLSGIRSALPSSLGESVDELGLLIAALFIFTTAFHFLLRLLDSSAGARQRADLSKAVAMERALRTMRSELETAKKAAERGENSGALEAQLRHASEDQRELEERKSALEAELRSLRAELRSLSGEATSASARAETAEGQSSQLQRRLKEAEEAATAEQRRAEASEAAKEEAERKLRKAAAEAERASAALSEAKEELESKETERKEAAEESASASDRAAELEGQVEGLKTILERLEAGSAAVAAADSGESNGWSDLGAEEMAETEAKRRERMAQLTNAAQLTGQLKAARAEVDRAKAAAQKETDARVQLELKLNDANDETVAKAERLERTEAERSDLLKQVSQLTGLIASKEAEAVRVKEEMLGRAESAQKTSRELESRLDSERERRASLEERYGEKEEAIQRLRKELDRRETGYFHDLRDKENRIRQLDMTIMQLRRHMAVSMGGNGSFEGPGSNNSSEAEMQAFLPEARPNLSPSPPSGDGWGGLAKGGSSSIGGGSAAAWGSMPSAPRRSGWLDEPAYDSHASADPFKAGSSTRRSKTSRDKSRGRRSVAEDGFAEEETASHRRHKHRRSRSRGARSEAAPPALHSEVDAPSPVPSTDKHRRRSSRPRKGPSPTEMDNPYPIQETGFDPIYGGPSSEGRGNRGGPSPPPLLSNPLPPPNAQPVPGKRSKGEKKKSKRDRD